MNNDRIKLSVIIPVYKVEEYLEECLDSVDLSIKNINAEVLIIDDGSPDGSTEIAKAFTESHDKFKYFRKENGGLSDARNYGAKRASGEYICFVDSDDVVTERIYENMLAAAEYHEADLTIVNVARMNSKKIWDSALHARVFNDNELNVTHISECDNLVYDTTSWNKLIRRSFWEENGFSYPVGWRYEDMTVSLAMHCRANRVALVREVGYLWRIRDGKSVSITQDNKTSVNLEHRLKMIDDMFEYIRSELNNDKRLYELLKRKVLINDLELHLNELATSKNEQLQQDYYRLINGFLEKYIVPEDYDRLPIILNQKYKYLLAHDTEGLRKAYSFGKEAYKTAEFHDDGKKITANLPGDIFTVSRRDVSNDYANRDPWRATIDAYFKGSGFSVFSACLINRLNISDSEDEDIEVYLCNTLSEARTQLPVKRKRCPSITRERGTVYERPAGKECKYNYDGAGYEFTLDLNEIDAVSFYGDNYILVKYKNKLRNGTFLFGVTNKSVREYLEDKTAAGSGSYAKSRFDANGNLFVEIGKAKDSDIRVETDDDAPCRADFLQADGDSFKLSISFPEELRKNKASISLVFTDTKAEKILTLADGKMDLESDPAKAILVVKPDNEDLKKNFYEGDRPLYIRFSYNEETIDLPVFADCTYKESVDTGTEIIDVLSDDGKLKLRIGKGVTYTKNQKHHARTVLYPQYRELPLDDKCIVFESYWGRQYSCNPRALYEYINEHHPEYKCVWSFEDERTPINGTAIRVKKYSPEYYYYLATAKFFVNNVNFENAYIKRRGQIEIQTMHGTPYKSMGLDVKADFLTECSVEEYIKRNSRWNYFLVQGQFSEQMAWQWFRYKGEILKTGYPRTDALFNISEDVKASLKKKLNLPADKKIIMYAPTFRKKGDFDMPLDLEYMRKHLSDEYILMIRLHHFIAEAYKVPEDGKFIFDLGSYNSIEDLYKITDVLITDYSSVMFDFALTGKPMVFFTYDLEKYTNELRGSYFDIQKEAPGPVVNTTEGVVGAILEDQSEYEERKQAFFDKYLTYEKGYSSEEIFKEVFIKNKPSKADHIIQSIKRALLKKNKQRSL